MYSPCFECKMRYGKEYTEDCDSKCEYANIISKLKPFGKIPKAVLVIDKPNKCLECSLCKKMEDNCNYCMATNKIIVDIDKKPRWCTLQEI